MSHATGTPHTPRRNGAAARTPAGKQMWAWVRRGLRRLEQFGQDGQGNPRIRTRLLAQRLLPPTPRTPAVRPADRLERRLEEWLEDTRLAYTLAGD